ncbi:MAG: hypothetical protein IPN26_14440 [Bacteroidetes bacterium]|nr:hypothetical protein [Bacteroidota bacterium]
MTEWNGANRVGGLEWHRAVCLEALAAFVTYQNTKAIVGEGISKRHDTESLCAGLWNEGMELLLQCGAEVGEINVGGM